MTDYIDSIFWYCVWILQVIGDVTGMGYNLLIVIFVILQPGLLFFILWRLEKRKNKKFI